MNVECELCKCREWRCGSCGKVSIRFLGEGSGNESIPEEIQSKTHKTPVKKKKENKK